MYVLAGDTGEVKQGPPPKRIAGLKIIPDGSKCDGFRILFKGKEKTVSFKEYSID